jgi:hypothetical protein
MDAVRIRSQGQSARRAKRCQSLVTSVFAADWNLTHFDEVKVDHLGEDGGLGTADVDSGASSGDTGLEASGLEHSSD